MKRLILIYFLLILTGCENNQNDMTVKVDVKNFKKGNIYLQKISDSTLINVDSVFVKKNEPIILKSKIDSPELFYLNLDVSNIENRIEFFGEKGEININTSLEKFNSDFIISGSSTDPIYRTYISVIKKINLDKFLNMKIYFKKSKGKHLSSIMKSEIIKDIINYNKMFAI